MIFAEDDLHTIVEEVWLTMLGLPVDVDDEPTEPGPHDVMAVVGVSRPEGAGADDEGAIISLRLAPELAGMAAAALFEIAPDDVSGTDITDALGELANITGGNVKALMGTTATLSLPTVATGDHLGVTVPSAQQTCQVGFRCLDHAFSLTIHTVPAAA